MSNEMILLYGLIAILFVVVIALFLSRNKAVKEKKQAKKNLDDTLSNLEAVYSEVNTTQEELNAKYRELKTSEEKIKKLAYEDAMTGLPNRAAFTEVLEHTMETLRKEESIAVMIIDLDSFKSLNELWGNACGDELILDVSHRLKQNLGDDDYLARSGSDEFLILSQNVLEPENFEEKVKRLQKAFRFPFVLSVGEFTITISIGVVIGPRDGKNASVLLRRADTALTQAKWLGKDTYCYYTEILEQKQLEDMELRTELTAAMKQNDFFLLYQPIWSMQDGTCVALRTELRWDRKEKGVWRARRFIRFAEETGQIISLGERAFRRVCKDVHNWIEAGMTDLDVIIPLSERQLMTASFEPLIRSIIEEEEVDISHFVFEISERYAITSYDDCVFVVNELAQRGFRFRLGDFGGGKMSFECIRNLPIEQVVIPYRRIYEEQDENHADTYFSVIISAIHALKKKVVIAELTDGIEEQRVKKRVAESDGTILLQGELYGESWNAKEVPFECVKKLPSC